MTDTPAGDAEPTFGDLGIDARLLSTLISMGYEHPSPIQAAAIPPLLAGSDVMGLAQTGTGKTAAFALPILGRIDADRHEPQALVLAPTRELAIQVAEAFARYAAPIPGLKVLPVYGGQHYGVQLSGLKRGPQVVVGTPGRVIDHLNRGTLDLSKIEYLVLDEADEMLAMGFAEEVDRILADTPEYKQVALFSATMPSAIRRIAAKHLHEPVEVKVASTTMTAATTRQRWLLVSHHDKLDALTRVLEVEEGDGMIIFVRTKQGAEELAERLQKRGFAASAINGDMAQAQRERTIGQLRSGAVDILVATDVAARGLDVERITHVVNYDIPHDPESYVHRIGRTGRAGRSGDALLFVTPRERRLLSVIEKTTKQRIEPMDLPSVDDVNARRVAKLAEQITTSLGSPQFHLFRTLVQDYVKEHDVDPLDVAAALAIMSNDDAEFLLKDAPKPARSERDRRDGEPRQARRGSGPAGRDDLVRYRIAVGKRQKVAPGAIVGALANEGGLRRSDFGKITIGADHSIVELPADLSSQSLDALSRTRISGKLIALRLDDGPRGRRDTYGDDRGPGAGRKKPRSKKSPAPHRSDQH